MKTGRCEHIAMPNNAVLPNFMGIVVVFIACSFTVLTHAQAEVPPAAEPKDVKDATVESNLEELITTVYCYCGCERETIEVCVCDTAAMIEKDFRNRLLAGQTVEQIRTNYLDTFGPQFYAVMPAEGINLLAYIMPAVILVLIGGIAFAVLRRSRQQSVASNGLEEPNQQVSDTTVKQVEAELERYRQQN